MWSTAERRTWAPDEALKPSEWAERYRLLTPKMTAEPGAWRNDRTPYLVGIMDTIAEEGVEEVVVEKATQIGFSELQRNILGYWIDCDPGHAMLVMPTEDSCREAFDERIKPLVQDTPRLKIHLTGKSDDVTLTRIKLANDMDVYSGWAGSPQSLATRPVRYLLFDEVDKYPAFSGREADPISLGKKRQTTFLHRARTVIGSTPTLRDGTIHKRFENCTDQRFYYMPCPHCEHHQRLTWDGIHWPKMKGENKADKAAKVDEENLAYYECESCKQRITDQHKPQMLRAGKWVGSDQVIDDAGRVEGLVRKHKRIGFHISALYSPWITFSQLAAEFIMATGDVAAMMDFKNSRMAEPFEVQSASVKLSVVRAKIAKAPPANIIPSWAGALFATADTQHRGFYWTIRAWGYEYRSQLIAHGEADTFDNLYDVCLKSRFKSEVDGVVVTPEYLLIDSGGTRTEDGGSRTSEVYQFALRDTARIKPCKGASHKQRGVVQATRLNQVGLTLQVLDTGFFKDMLSNLMGEAMDPEDETSPDKWMPNAACGEDYEYQMSSEHKIFDHKRRRELWVPMSSGIANHYWDCEVYQCAAAYMGNVSLIPTPEEAIKQQRESPGAKQRQQNKRRTREGGSDWLNSHRRHG